MNRSFLLLIIAAIGFFSASRVARCATPAYSIKAIRFASGSNVPLSEFVIPNPGENPDDTTKIDAAFVIWLIQGGGRTILFDSGYHRDTFAKDFNPSDYLQPDQAVKLAGIQPGQITDIVISHAHWDHMGGIDLFPRANIWIQSEEYRYYTGPAWQPEGDHGGIDPADVTELVKLNTQGRLHLVNGDDVEIFPGIRAYTGARHTYASQYLLIDGKLPFVLASDNCYLYRNLATHHASATFSDADHAANIAAQARMLQLAGSPDRVIPGHDPIQFDRYHATGRIATIE